MNPINLIIMIFLISMLVLVHEWGHYIAARAFGVKVSKFGFGMPIGPVLYKTKKGDLEILVHACLLGGYVSFPDDEETKENEPVLPLDSLERFKNKKPYQQAIIVSAGVIMNFIFAFFLIFLASLVFHKLPTGKTEVFVNEIVEGGQTEKNYKDMIQVNDKILKVNNIDIESTYQFIFLVQNSKLNDGKADNKIIQKKLDEFLKLNPSIRKDEIIPSGTKIRLPDKTPEEPLIVSDIVSKGLEKYKSGEIELSQDEIILRDEIFNRKVYVLTRDSSALEIATAISDYYKPINIVLERKGEQISINNLKTSLDGTLGIKLSSEEIFTPTKDLKSAFTNSSKYMARGTGLTCFGLWQLFTGKIPISEMHGIVAIAKVGSDIIEQRGMLNGLLLTAIISINLAIINLLPIPALDGGHLLFILAEKIAGKPLDENAVNKISNACFAFLILLMVFVIANDIFALVTGKF